MTEPTITCPKCRTEIRLTESLAAPLIESTRREYEKLLAQKDTDIATREKALREREQVADEDVFDKCLNSGDSFLALKSFEQKSASRIKEAGVPSNHQLADKAVKQLAGQNERS